MHMSVRNYTFTLLAVLVVIFVVVCYLVINGRVFSSFIELERNEGSWVTSAGSAACSTTPSPRRTGSRASL